VCKRAIGTARSGKWHNYFWLMTSFNVAWQQRDSKTSAKTAIKSQLNGVQSSGNQQQH